MGALAPLAIDLGHFLSALILVLMRVGAMLMATPVFRSTGMPARVRLSLALILSALAVAALPPGQAMPALDASLLTVAVSEVALGIAMGLMIQLVFAALTIAGEGIAMGMGLGFSTMIDPQNGDPVPTLSQLFVLLATLLFIILDGHLHALGMLFSSFELLPPGTQVFSQAQNGVLIEWAATMYTNALFIALPILVAMLLTNVIFGVITRAAPQLNLFAIGFPLMLSIGIAVLYLHVSHVTEGTAQLLTQAFTRMAGLMVNP